MADRLRSLGLTAMADALLEMRTTAAADDLSREDWLGLLLDRERTNASAAGSATRGRARMRSSRTLISVPRVASTAPCSTSLLAATGSGRASTW
jgi:hypothetical protein